MRARVDVTRGPGIQPNVTSTEYAFSSIREAQFAKGIVWGAVEHIRRNDGDSSLNIPGLRSDEALELHSAVRAQLKGLANPVQMADIPDFLNPAQSSHLKNAVDWAHKAQQRRRAIEEDSIFSAAVGGAGILIRALEALEKDAWSVSMQKFIDADRRLPRLRRSKLPDSVRSSELKTLPDGQGEVVTSLVSYSIL